MVKVIDRPNKFGIPKEPNGKQPTPVLDLTESVESEEDAVRVVRALVESSRIREARERTDEFLQIWPDSKLLQIGKRILAPSVAKVVPSTKPPRSRTKENEWIKSNARNFPGQWLLVFEDRLIAGGPDLSEVIRQGQTTEDGKEGVLWFQPGPEWISNKNT